MCVYSGKVLKVLIISLKNESFVKSYSSTIKASKVEKISIGVSETKAYISPYIYTYKCAKQHKTQSKRKLFTIRWDFSCVSIFFFFLFFQIV